MDLLDKGDSYTCSFSRGFVFELWYPLTSLEAEKKGKVLEKMLEILPNVENVDISDLDSRVLYICKKVAEFWKNCHRIKNKVVSKHSDWLKKTEIVTLPKLSTSSSSHTPAKISEFIDKRRGRPVKDFSECSARSKRRRLAELGKTDQSTVNSLLETSERSNTSVSEMDTDEVVSLITEAKLTKHQYILIKNFVNSRPNMFLPSYQKVLAAKQRCYPEEIRVTESSAEVELQSLLDHTTKRILESQKEVLAAIDYESRGDLFLIGKWDFDGSTGHSEYKQVFKNTETEDSSLFVTSYVPLRLVSVVATSSEEKIVWKNPRPSSTRYCRPIRFQFAKESKELTIEEERYFQEKIEHLVPTKFKFQDKEIEVNHSLQLTMVDGKVCSSLSECSNTKCYLCGARPTEMNDIDGCLQRSIDHSKFEFGLSPLHSWIRFFEYFIHVSYKIFIKKWQARSAEEKQNVASRKKQIQDDFRRTLGLVVDKPRSGGSGSTNDGNTARRFFSNAAVSAEITGIPLDLIERCGTILECLSSGHKINVNRYEAFATETARKLVTEFPWYNLPSSLHKVLIHGPAIIENALLPIGELSEEAAESSNKNLKAFRREHTRKISRETTNLDLINRLLLNSDPFITNFRKLPRKKSPFYQKQLQLY